MRILVEILHPAHVHVFRHAIHHWLNRGDQVLVLSRDKECTHDLLKAYRIEHHSLSKIGETKVHLLSEMLIRDIKMLRHACRFKPDVLIGIMGVTIVQVGRLIRKPAIVFYDTENAQLTNRFVYPLAHSVCTPSCYRGKVNGNHITYPGYHELAYLHPNRFKPDPTILEKAGVDPQKPFFILRFVSWQASHDVGEQGLSTAFKKKLIEQLSSHGQVLISSEAPLPDELRKHQFRLPPETIHHFLAYAHIVIGESATMASEAAVLGTPAFFISDTGRGYTEEQEKKFGLVYNFTRKQMENALEKIKELLTVPHLKTLFAEKRAQLLREYVDTTSWMIDYIDQVNRVNRK